MKFIRTILITALVATPLLAQTPETWGIDKAHSSATFKVRHIVSQVGGSFSDFDAAINLDRAKPQSSSVEFTIQATSINTGNENRDNHLRSADFFDVAKFPTISFKSTSIKAKSKNEYDVTGNLTMHGVTKTVTLPVTFLGFASSGGKEKGGFEIETTLNRKDYGILWNKALDEGGVLLGDDVKVLIDLEVGKKAPAAAPAATK
ncbi:MAG: protein yceI precursor [Acidobacteria bacterium]|nr:MAG: protein yceI precursor [Acidobacteriota bacterium]